MYGIYANIWGILMVNVTHIWVVGKCSCCFHLCRFWIDSHVSFVISYQRNPTPNLWGLFYGFLCQLRNKNFTVRTIGTRKKNQGEPQVVDPKEETFQNFLKIFPMFLHVPSIFR